MSGTYRPVNRGGGEITREHVIVAEKALGRRLPRGAKVHHVDGDRRHNANGNLVICQDNRYHMELHVRLRVLRAGGRPFLDGLCSRCKAVKPRDEFYVRKSGIQAGCITNYCRDCSRRVAKDKYYARRAA